MEPELVLDQQIRSQIEELREQFPQTKDLYREVCVLLFFRYGVTPTANKLYQLVRKGSMSAPSEALAQFWRNMREKSRVRIEHPDLPEDLKEAAGELIASLWGKAQSLALESLAAFREQANASMLEAQSRQAAAEAHQRELAQELLTSQQDYAAAIEKNRSLEQQLASALAIQTKIEGQFEQERKANEALQHALDATQATLENTHQDLEKAIQELESTKQESESTRQGLIATIERQKTSIETAEIQHRHETTVLSTELNLTQTKADQLQKNIEALHAATASASDQYRIDSAKLQGENGDLRQQIGVFEGKLQGAIAEHEALSREVKELRNYQNKLNVEVGMARAEAEIWKNKAQNLEDTLTEISKPSEAASDDGSHANS
jgi:chromosome segregation ATPase